jgi:hypothetical protein
MNELQTLAFKCHPIAYLSAERQENEPHSPINSLSAFYFKSYHKGNDLVISSKDALLSSSGQKWPQMTWTKVQLIFEKTIRVG